MELVKTKKKFWHQDKTLYLFTTSSSNNNYFYNITYNLYSLYSFY